MSRADRSLACAGCAIFSLHELFDGLGHGMDAVLLFVSCFAAREEISLKFFAAAVVSQLESACCCFRLFREYLKSRMGIGGAEKMYLGQEFS